MENLYKLVKASNKRFPDGVEPFQMATRLLEEAGEIAAEINHRENAHKRAKLGEPNKKNLANELRQAIVECLKIAVYYKCEDELEESINEHLKLCKNEGLID